MSHCVYDKRHETELLCQVQALLDTGEAEKARELVRATGHRSKAVVNAYGVCLLRIGRIDEAMGVFRKLVNCGLGFNIDPDTPTVFQTNYATALLLGKHPDGGVGVLNQIEEQEHPAVVKIRQAIDQWKQTLGRLRRLLIPLLGLPDATVPIAFPPGDLWIPDPDRRGQRAA